MMTQLFALVIFLVLLAVVVHVMGEYIGWLYRDEVNSRGELLPWFGWFEALDGLFAPVENLIYRVIGLDAEQEMDWLDFLKAVLVFNGLLFVLTYLIFYFQGYLPLNPLGLEGLSWHQAFHTASTFTANTNQQHYGGEVLSAFSQIFGVGLAMFLSAATGLALAPAFVRGITNEEEAKLGNFYVNLVRGSLRFLLPVALLVGLVLIFQGAPQVMGGQWTYRTLESARQVVRVGPVAGVEAIKMLGTNGGGFFAANAAHPFENPTILTDLILNLIMLAAPIAVIYAFGVWLGKRRHGVILISALLVLFIALTGLSVSGELQPNRGVDVTAGELTVDQSVGNMEGKEQRFGPALSALWGVSTTATTNGAVNSMHNSFTARGSLGPFLAMSMNCLFNGLGVGLLNLMTYIFVCVFIAGLMIGRAPQYLGKQIEWEEVQIAALIILLLPVLVLFPTALAVILETGTSAMQNPGFRGFSEVLYEMFSAAANNGSGFEGLADNRLFYNLVNGVLILCGRYLPILGQLLIAGSLAAKKIRPSTEGTLNVESFSFLVLFIGVMVIIGGLIFMPALAVGPVAEMLGGGM